MLLDKKEKIHKFSFIENTFFGLTEVRMPPKKKQQNFLFPWPIHPQCFIKIAKMVQELLCLKQRNYLQNGCVDKTSQSIDKYLSRYLFLIYDGLTDDGRRSSRQIDLIHFLGPLGSYFSEQFKRLNFWYISKMEREIIAKNWIVFQEEWGNRRVKIAFISEILMFCSVWTIPYLNKIDTETADFWIICGKWEISTFEVRSKV